MNTLSSEFEVDDDGRYTSFAVLQTRHPDFPTLRRHRIGVGLYDRDERPAGPSYHARDRRRAARAPTCQAGRRDAAGPGAAQRRRPDLRQDPVRRAVAATVVVESHRLARRLAGAGAVLGGAVGHDPRRRAAPPATSSPSCCRASAPRPTRPRSSSCRSTCSTASTVYAAPDQARRPAGDLGERPARAARATPSRAATTSWPSARALRRGRRATSARGVWTSLAGPARRVA